MTDLGIAPTMAARSGPGLFGRIGEDAACIAARDPAARGGIETWLVYPGLQAIALHRIAHALWTRDRRLPARLLAWFARLLTNVDIHPGARIGRRFFIDHGAGVVIGETAEIGDDVTLYHGVTLGGVAWTPGRRHPSLGNGVLVGAGAKILGPIHVADGARVGANSVVIDDVPPAATVVGIPGRIVRPAEGRRRLAGGRIDLDHHLMPDPVGEAIAALIDRIDFLEVRLADAQARLQRLDTAGAATGADRSPVPEETRP